MLCDEVYATLKDPLARRSLAEAHKFVLTEEFKQVAGQITRTPEDCDALRHLFRLPYDRTWLEFHGEGMRWGILMENVVGSLREYYEQAPKNGIHVDSYEGSIRITRSIDHFITSSWLAFPQSFFLTGDGQYGMKMASFSDELPDEMRDQVLNESILYCIYLATLNSRNLIEVESSDLERLNRRREKNNKPPLFEYKTLRIKRDIRRMMRESETADNDNAPGVRSHWRRGHFKVRKTGVFWWSPHMAGKAELGQIEKKYVA